MRLGPLIALSFVAGLACSKKSEPTTPNAPASPPPADEKPDPELLAGIAAGLEEVLVTMATITEDAADCAAMASNLTRLFDQSTELFDLARREGADPDAGPLLVAELDRRAAAVEPLLDRIQKGLARCQMDPAVRAAIDRMPTF
jgi:hypothetical protein